MQPSSSRYTKTPYKDDSDDDSFDDLQMSPPVTMSPARPPRSSAELGLLKVGQSPVKQAAARIRQDLLRTVHASNTKYGTESSMSTVSTPPSLSRYHRDETSESVTDSMESMMRRVGLEPPGGTTPGLRLRPKVPASQKLAHDNDINTNLFAPGYSQTGYSEEYHEQDLDSDSDSLDMGHNAGPSAAFLMASLGRPVGDDDSFGSSNHSNDSLGGDDGVLVHPFGGSLQDDGFGDDSFGDDDDPQEETVFGVPPAERNRLAAARQQGLHLHGGNLMDDTVGAEIVAGAGMVNETPTPAAWGEPAHRRS